MGNSSRKPAKQTKARHPSKAKSRAPPQKRVSIRRKSTDSSKSVESDNPLFDTPPEQEEVSPTTQRPSFGRVPESFGSPPPPLPIQAPQEGDVSQHPGYKQLYDLLVEFYFCHDPARLTAGQVDLDGIIEWALQDEEGYPSLNARLFERYEDDLSSFQSVAVHRAQPPSTHSAHPPSTHSAHPPSTHSAHPPSTHSAHPPSTRSAHPPSTHSAHPPPPRESNVSQASNFEEKRRLVHRMSTQPPQMRRKTTVTIDELEEASTASMPSEARGHRILTHEDDMVFQGELERFFLQNDPIAMNDGTMAEMYDIGIRFGRDFTNGRLRLKYGADLGGNYTRTGSIAEDTYLDHHMNAEEKKQYVTQIGVASAPASVLQEMSKHKLRGSKLGSMMVPPPNQDQPRKDSSLERKWAMKKVYTQESAGAGKVAPRACNNYCVDVTASTVGACVVCGRTKDEHRAPAGRPSANGGAFTTHTRPVEVEHAAQAPSAHKNPPRAQPAQTSNPLDPSSKPCTNYALNVSGAGFGLCVCGFSKPDHGK